MSRHSVILRLLFCAFVAVAANFPLSASAYDPSLEWHTVVSPNFRVHYSRGLYVQALEAARRAENAFATMTARLEWRPATPIDIVLDDETDSANGFSRAYPYNLIGLNAVAPDDTSVLSDYDDWLNLLIAHELVHDVHIDQIHGLPWLVNSVLGRVLVPNSAQPSWFTEGLAVYFETDLTSRGRLRSSYFDMLLRMQVLRGREMSLDEITGSPLRWPQGTAAYLYGAHFLDWIRLHYDERTLRDIGHDYGSQIIPYGLNVTSTKATGREYSDLYAEFMNDTRARYHAQENAVREAGQIEGERLTARGQDIGGARVMQDGSIVFFESPIGDQTRLRVRSPSGEERVIARLNGAAELAVMPNQREVLVVQNELSDVYYVFGDLFRVDLESGDKQRLTESMRAFGLDVNFDGSRAVFGSNDGGHSFLRLIDVENPAHVEVLADLGESTNVYNPHFAPDGKTVVFSGFKGGQRDLYTVDLASREIRQLTFDRAVDSGAIYSPDGKWIYFHSDRTGVFDIYAMSVATAEVRRVTRVVGGAFDPQPSPDGTFLVYRSYDSEGFDLSRVEVTNSDVWPVAEADSVLRPEAQQHTRLDTYPSKPYSPAGSVYPRAWLPILGQDPRGDTIGFEVTGADALGRHAFDLQYTWGTDSHFNSFVAVYQNQTFRYGFNLSLQRSLGFAAVPVRTASGVTQYVEEEQYYGTLSTSIPLYRRFFNAVSLGLSYNVRYRSEFEAPTEPVTPVAPPEFGFFNSAAATLTYSNTRSYLGSISPQDGIVVSLGGRVEAPWLGSEYTSRLGTLDFSGYLTNPWFKRHVLSVNLYGAYGVSSYDRRRLFSIAGLPSRNLILDALSGRLASAQALRGFPLTPYSGNCLVEAHLEYRFPIFDFYRGIDTLPLFFRTFHVAPFLDGAAIADKPGDLHEGTHYSVGAEARLGVTIAYSIFTTLRFGYGHGLGADSNIDGFFVLLSNNY